MTEHEDTPTGDTHDHLPVRNGNGQFADDPAATERAAQAVRLRAQGVPLAQIARQLGYADASGARRAIDKALTRVVANDVEELRSLENEKLDVMTREAWAVIARRPPVVSAGGKIVHGPDGEPLRDPMPVLAALDRLVKIADRRAKLLGLDAPKRVELTTVITEEMIDAEIARLNAEVAELDRETGALPPAPGTWGGADDDA